MSAETTNKVHIESEMSDSYMDYAMSVIVARALPDARDGLKPVHRRILYAMHEMGMRAGAEYKKSARVVGEVLGKFHPHGDAAVYDTMVRLVQDFAMRNPLLEGQGNFGSIDGDGPAAMRYTEVRMAALGEEMMVDISQETVPFADNFDGTLREPVVLPGKIPNLLINGASGIAVGMATSIPPHNLGEVCTALRYMLENWLRLEEITVEELMQFIKGPDFPTGGLLFQHPDGGDEEGNSDSLRAAYQSGRGKITIRSRLHVEPIGQGRMGIVITQLPYQVNKASLVERIAVLARSGRLEGLADLRDESDRKGLRLVLELGRNVEPEVLLPLLYRYTLLQDTYSIILLALVDGEPRLLSLKRVLSIFLEHRLVVLRRRSIFELRRAEERAHILKGLLIALSKLDVVMEITRRSRRIESARQNLRKALKITSEQARAILELPLGRLVALERRKIRADYQSNQRRIRELQSLLGSDEQQRAVIREELNELQEHYQDTRRTLITDGSAQVSLQNDNILPEFSWVTLSTTNRLGRIDQQDAPRPNTRNRDTTFQLRRVDVSQPLFAFTASGYVSIINPRDLPKIRQAHEGQGIVYVSTLPSNERVVSLYGVKSDESVDGFLLLVTAGGLVKRIRTTELSTNRRDAVLVMKIPKEDQLLTVVQHSIGDEIVMVSSDGRMLCFSADQVRPAGLSAGGVRGMKLRNDEDRVVSAVSAPKESDAWLWFITADGLAGRTKLTEFPRYQRGAQGVLTMRKLSDNLGLGAAAIGKPSDQLHVISNIGRGRIVRMSRAPVLKRGIGRPAEMVHLRDRENITAVLNLTVSSSYS